ncbi:MAG: hypothetical protein ACJ8J0_05480 [Longimicrobiaceae bacterium]
MAATLALGGCMDMDPFGLAHRRIAGAYGLEQWEDFRTYYLIEGAGFGTGTDALDGRVERIGWNRRYIAVRRFVFSEDRSEWMIVDSKKREIHGPFTYAELARHPEVRGIRLMSADEAWKSLPVRPNGFSYFLLAVLAAGFILYLRRRADPRRESPRPAKAE